MKDYPPAWRGWFGRRGNDGLTNLERKWYADKYSRIVNRKRTEVETLRAKEFLLRKRLDDIIEGTVVRCAGTRNDGDLCRNWSERGRIYCWNHRSLDGPKDTTEPS